MTAERRGSVRFGKFLAVGGLAAAVNVIARILFSEVAPYEIAVVLAFPIALTTAFLLNRLYVFEEAGDGASGQYARFTLVNLLALAQVWVISVGLARIVFPAIGWEWHAELIAHAVGVASPVITSYHLHRWFTFRR